MRARAKAFSSRGSGLDRPDSASQVAFRAGAHWSRHEQSAQSFARCGAIRIALQQRLEDCGRRKEEPDTQTRKPGGQDYLLTSCAVDRRQPLVIEPQRKLHRARLVALGVDRAEGGLAPVRVRIAEEHAVEEIAD